MVNIISLLDDRQFGIFFQKHRQLTTFEIVECIIV